MIWKRFVCSTFWVVESMLFPCKCSGWSVKNWTPVFRVTGRDAHHYTTEEFKSLAFGQLFACLTVSATTQVRDPVLAMSIVVAYSSRISLPVLDPPYGLIFFFVAYVPCSREETSSYGFKRFHRFDRCPLCHHGCSCKCIATCFFDLIWVLCFLILNRFSLVHHQCHPKEYLYLFIPNQAGPCIRFFNVASLKLTWKRSFCGWMKLRNCMLPLIIANIVVNMHTYVASQYVCMHLLWSLVNLTVWH